jgi:hypothetical protein
MRSNLLMLGLLIPFGIAFAWYSGAGAATGPSAVERLYAADGASVVTGDIDAMISGEAAPPRREEGSANEVDAGSSSDWFRSLAEWLPQRSSAEPLLVILVSGKERVAIARTGVRNERISGENAEAFVVDGNRVVAASRDAAAAMIMLFDWVDRPIQLVAAAPKKTHAVLRTNRRNSGAAELETLGSVAADVAAVRGSAPARVEAASRTIRNATR